jgi:hypothetical protein
MRAGQSQKNAQMPLARLAGANGLFWAALPGFVQACTASTLVAAKILTSGDGPHL